MVRAALLHLLRSQSSHHLSTNTPSVYHCFRSSTCGRPISANPTFKTSSQLAAAQIRWASQATTTDDKETEVVYHGPMSSKIKEVKLLSLINCCLAVSMGPFITFLDVNVILKDGYASSLIFLTTSLAAAYHWMYRPYIHKLRWQPGSDSFEVEMMSWYATYITKTIKFADIRPRETKYRPYVLFKANGNFYFVDLVHCRNKALLVRLMENL